MFVFKQAYIFWNKNCCFVSILFLSNQDQMRDICGRFYIPYIICTRQHIILNCIFRGEDSWNFSQSDTRTVHDGNVFCWIHTKWGTVVDDLPNSVPIKFGSNWPCTFVVSEKIIKILNVNNDDDRRAKDTKWWQKLTWYLARWA
jgi:hypothetical protein